MRCCCTHLAFLHNHHGEKPLPLRGQLIPVGLIYQMTLHVFTRLKTSWKSAPFLVRTKFESLSKPLQLCIRFFQPPLPTYSSVFLTVDLPKSELYLGKQLGLPSSIVITQAVQVLSVHRRSHDDVFPDVKGTTDLEPFGQSVSTIFRSLRLTVFINSSLTLTMLLSLALNPHIVYGLLITLTGFELLPQRYIVRELRTEPLPVMHYPQATVSRITGLTFIHIN